VLAAAARFLCAQMQLLPLQLCWRWLGYQV
jgi:hypothetical protein